MVIFISTIIGIFVFVEYYSLGVALLAKKCGSPDWKKCMIPFYAFYEVGKITGGFKVLSIPVKKFHFVMGEFALFAALAVLYACWGDSHLPEVSSESLWQIMSVIIILMSLLAWISLVVSSERLFRRFNVERKTACVLLCALVVTIPCVYAFVARNTPRALEDMY